MIKGVPDENFNQNHGGSHSGSSNTPYTEDEQVAIHFDLRDSTFRNVSATQAAFASGMKEEHVHRTGQEIDLNIKNEEDAVAAYHSMYQAGWLWANRSNICRKT